MLELIVCQKKLKDLKIWKHFICLEKLVISSNRLEKIPSTIQNLEKLQYLSLNHNKFKTLPQEIGNLIELKELYLSYNQLEKFAPEIGNLAKLEFLYINGNKITKIPKEIGDLINLKVLVIGKNSLSTLPDEIGNLTRLTELNIAFSGPMLGIPESIQNCKKLEYLYIDKSILLPYSIGKMNPRLKIIVKEAGELNI